MTDLQPDTHPVQFHPYRALDARAPRCVTLAAYEVYKHLYGDQRAMVTGGCRGGFGIGELMAFLYARSFPKDQWAQRVKDALTGMVMP
jgi:hypothetical protein